MQKFWSHRRQSTHRRGYVLIEILTASVLLSIVGAGLYAGIAQSLRMETTVRRTSALYVPFKLLWMTAEKDLRNAVSLRSDKFVGRQEEIMFPAIGISSQLYRSRYFVKDGYLMRSEEKLPQKFVREHVVEQPLLKGIEKLRFEYAYLDEEQRLVFKPLWMEQPYFGIPKAVRIEIKLKNEAQIFSRTIALPQGRWGHFASEEENHG